MSVSQHPVALRLERQVGGATRLLGTVMGLPLVDGIFAALVLAGAVNTAVGIIQTGLLIFGGSATVAVILAEMDGTRREQAMSVLLLGALLLPAAALEAALAPTIKSVIAMATFERFAGLVILAVAAKTASAKVGEYLPGPGVIIGLGLVASFDPSGVELVVNPNAMAVAKGTAAAGVGVAFALAVALLSPQLRGAVDIDLFRFGSAVALGMLALDVLGLMPTQAPVALGVLCVTAVFSYDPESAGDGDAERAGTDASADSTTPLEAQVTVADGGDGYDGAPEEPASVEDGPGGYGYPGEDEQRAPWL